VVVSAYCRARAKKKGTPGWGSDAKRAHRLARGELPMTLDLVGARPHRYPLCVPGGTITDVRFTLILSDQQNKPAEYCIKLKLRHRNRWYEAALRSPTATEAQAA
jgi:hypothetical protein